MKTKSPFVIALGIMALSFTTASLFKNPLAPISYTGAPKFGATPTVRYCTSCHSDFAINTAGGSVVATGLPSGTYVAGQVYNFTIKITEPSSVLWGFSIKAANTVNNANVGVFSTTNANAIVQGTIAANTQELSQNNAQAGAGTYTYLNLRWTAPAVPTANEQNIRFYIVGVAADNSLDELGDFVYSTTINATLSVVPVSLISFNASATKNDAVNINWQTAQETNTAFFDVETSTNSIDWLKQLTIKAKGNSGVSQSYSMIDNKPIAYNSNIYYRLKIVDRDAAFKYSEIQTINISHVGIEIYNLTTQPMQASTNAIFNVHSAEKKLMNITVTDLNGRQLYKQSNMITNGISTIEIPCNNLRLVRGMVLITFSSNGFIKTFKQIII